MTDFVIPEGGTGIARRWRYWFATQVALPEWMWNLLPARLLKRIAGWQFK